MSFDIEIDKLIVKYLEATGSTTSLANLPKYLRIWSWWKAMAHYKLNDHFSTLEEVPDDFSGMWFVVVDNQEKREYRRIDGKWRMDQKITLEECKNIY